jgi:hypothetical protein
MHAARRTPGAAPSLRHSVILVQCPKQTTTRRRHIWKQTWVCSTEADKSRWQTAGVSAQPTRPPSWGLQCNQLGLRKSPPCDYIEGKSALTDCLCHCILACTWPATQSLRHLDPAVSRQVPRRHTPLFFPFQALVFPSHPPRCRLPANQRNNNHLQASCLSVPGHTQAQAHTRTQHVVLCRVTSRLHAQLAHCEPPMDSREAS